MRAASYFLATAALLLSSCNRQTPEAPANGAQANLSPSKQAIFCTFEPSDTKEWTGKANADQSVTVEGKAYSADPKYKATLFQHEVNGSAASVFLSKAENKGEAPADGWWPVSYTIPDNGSIQTVDIRCDLDTTFETISVRRGGQSESRPLSDASKRVAFRGCPRIVHVEKPEGCMVVKTDAENHTTQVYNIDSATPRPDPNRLIIEGTGIYNPETIDICQAGKVLTDVKWQYTKAKCPLGDEKP